MAGLIRDIFTTNLLGASIFHDIFVVVLKIPNVFRKFFAEGAFSQAFIPIYSEYLGSKDHNGSQDFLNALFGILLSALFMFTALALLFAPIFILIFAPGFYFDIQKQDLAISLLRIMFPYLALISLVAFAAGIQNSHNKFSIPAITPLNFQFEFNWFGMASCSKNRHTSYGSCLGSSSSRISPITFSDCAVGNDKKNPCTKN